MIRRGRIGKVLLLVVVLGLVAVAPATAQVNQGRVTAGISLDDPNQTVGNQNQPGTLTMDNTSIGTNSVNFLLVTGIRVMPSCNTGNFSCPVADRENAISLDTPATGVAGTACAGITFTVSGSDANGASTFTPSAPVTLGPSNPGGAAATCFIRFSADITARPADGQTFMVFNVTTEERTPADAPTGNLPSNTQQTLINIAQAPVGVTTTASQSGAAPGSTTADVAVVAENPPVPNLTPTGTVMFSLLSRPGDAGACVAPNPAIANSVQTVAVGPSGPDAATASTNQTVTITAPGVYYWTATYSGDVNFAPVATAVGCGDPGERVEIQRPIPGLDVQKTADPTARPEPGGQFVFTVRMLNAGPTNITITSINDNVYGNLATHPSSTCGTLIGTMLAADGGEATCTLTVQFTGAPRAQTDTVTVRGTDSFGSPAEDTDDATITITAVAPALDVAKTANPASRPEPGGSYTFTVAVANTSSPGDPVTIQAINDNVYGNVANPANPALTGTTCDALIGTVVAPGASASCTFTVSFTGAPRSQTDVVTVGGVDDEGTRVEGSDDATIEITALPPSIQVAKTASPSSRPAPGGDFTFTVQITNTSGPGDPVTIQTINDNIYGNLATRAGSTCGPLVGTMLAPGATSAPCSFTAPFTGSPGATQTDLVTVTGVDDENTAVMGSDEATVFLTGPPTIDVRKDASPLTRPEPGGDFIYTIRVSNTGSAAITVQTITDNVFGDLATRAGSTCGPLVGTTLAPGASSAPCSFTAPFIGNAGASLTDVVTVTGADAAGNPARDTDDATVGLTDVLAVIGVTKAASPLTRPAPGGTYTFIVQVQNPGTVEPLVITGLTDNIYGDLATRPGSTCGALIGTTLAPGAGSPACTFTGDFTGVAGATQTDTVTATGRDDENNRATATAQATVGITSVTPQIVVSKGASPPSRPEPGGTFTFTVQVFNNGPIALRITTVTDDVHGDLAGRPGSTCGTLIGTTLATGASAACTFTGDFTGPPGASQTDTVTVVAVDPNGATTTDTDDATVFITNLPSSIRVQKDATPVSRPEPGGVFTFAVTVLNPSTVDGFIIRILNDDVYGNLASWLPPSGGTACSTLIGGVVGPGQVAACSFTGTFTGRGGQSQTDVVTVAAVDDDGQPLSATDDATVTLTTVPPTVSVTKSASPASRPVPGGDFTFLLTVLNTSSKPVTVTSMVDDVFGSLNGRETCAAGAVLQPNQSYACSFTASVQSGVPRSQTDTITVLAVDGQGNPAVGQAQATVRIDAATAVLSEQQQQPRPLPLPRTGADLRKPAGVATAMVTLGFVLVALAWQARRPAILRSSSANGGHSRRQRGGLAREGRPGSRPGGRATGATRLRPGRPGSGRPRSPVRAQCRPPARARPAPSPTRPGGG